MLTEILLAIETVLVVCLLNGRLNTIIYAKYTPSVFYTHNSPIC
jgi:hypothetical protein